MKRSSAIYLIYFHRTWVLVSDFQVNFSFLYLITLHLCLTRAKFRKLQSHFSLQDLLKLEIRKETFILRRRTMMDRPKWSMIHQDVAIASQIFLFSRAFISMILTIDNQYVYERQTWSSNWSCKMRWLWVIGTAQSKVMTKSYFGPNQQFFLSLKLGSLSTLTIHRKFNACMYAMLT